MVLVATTTARAGHGGVGRCVAGNATAGSYIDGRSWKSRERFSRRDGTVGWNYRARNHDTQALVQSLAVVVAVVVLDCGVG
jgi:hypothetical protein